MVVCVAVVAWLAVVATKGDRAVRDARSGEATARRIEGLLTPSTFSSAPVLADLEQAEQDLTHAHAVLSSAWLAPARVVPLLGRQISSARHLSTSGIHAIEVARRALRRLQTVIDGPHATGVERIARLRQAAAAAGSAAAALRGLDFGPSGLLLPPLARARRKFVDDVQRAETRLAAASETAGALANLLTGPSKYLVLFANNAEMRSGSGAFLDVGVLSIAGGRSDLEHLEPSSSLILPGRGVPISGDLAARWGWLEPNVDWRQLGLTPNFPTTAALAARMWKAKTGQQVDGVISVDIAALQDFLATAGPVDADGTEVTSANVLPLLMRYQYVNVSSDAAQARRQAHLDALADAVFFEMTSPHLSIGLLLDTLKEAVEGRHLMIWSPDRSVEAAWAAEDATGSVNSDDLMVSVINRGADKLDQYLEVTDRVSTKPVGDDTAVTLDVSLHNGTPADVPPYALGTGTGPPVPAGTYSGILSVNLPGDAVDPAIVGHPTLVAAGAEGPLLVLGLPVSIARGETEHFEVRFELRGQSGGFTVLPSARIPMETWITGDGSFTDSTAHRVSWAHHR